MTEAELIQGLRSGQTTAIKYLVEGYHKYLYAVCFNILKRIPESEEAANDCFLKILKKVNEYDDSKPFKAWLFTIAYHTAIDYYRKRKATLPQDEVPSTSTNISSDDAILATEQKTQIAKLLSHLDEDDANILRLYYLNEMSIKELAVATGWSEANLKVKLYRSRKELAKYVDLYFDKN